MPARGIALSSSRVNAGPEGLLWLPKDSFLILFTATAAGHVLVYFLGNALVISILLIQYSNRESAVRVV